MAYFWKIAKIQRVKARYGYTSVVVVFARVSAALPHEISDETEQAFDHVEDEVLQNPI